MRKIAFAGPSGLGKTTLANLIAGQLNIPHPSTSAGDLFTHQDKAFLLDNFGYEGAGHKAVINLSAKSPDFGLEFQKLILTRRHSQITLYDEVVLDRCPIDNVVYLLTQVGHNFDEATIHELIAIAQEAYTSLSHVIMIKYSKDIPHIEDNNSRVPNRYFQQYISDVFGGVYTRYFAHLMGPQVMTIDFWDLAQRIDTVKGFVSSNQQEITFEED